MDLVQNLFHQPEHGLTGLLHWPNFFGGSHSPTALDTVCRNSDMKPYTSILTADLIEEDTKYYVHADLPGVEDIDIQVQDGVLNIIAERKFVRDDAKNQLYERSFGRLRRSILLPKNADIEQSDARMKNGVLTISFPKKELLAAPEAPKKIPISA